VNRKSSIVNRLPVIRLAIHHRVELPFNHD